MATKTVTGTLKRSDNTPVAGALVTAQLSAQAVISGTQEIAPVYISTSTAADGTWSLTLQANGDLTPSTTNYAVSVGPSFYCTAIVPQTAGPFELSNIMAPPPPLGAAWDATLVHLAGTETITGDKVFTGSHTVKALAISGATGATNPSRYMGATVSGPPISGVWQVGDFVVDESGTIQLCVGSLYRQTVINDQPTAYWRLNDSGGVLLDQMGAYNATKNGTITSGVAGALTDGDTAVTLDGSTGYISLTTPLPLLRASYSVEFWAKMASNTANPVFMEQATADGAHADWFFILVGHKVRFQTGGSTSAEGGTPDDNAWHHWVGTFENGYSNLYRDGVLVDGPRFNVPDLTGTQIISIGRGLPGNNYLPGSLDEIAIYQRCLTPAQIASHYNAGVAAFFYAFKALAGATLKGQPVVGGATRSASVVVAAANASAASKASADYVCTGLNDDIPILAAWAALPASGGLLYLTEGSFSPAAQLPFTGKAGRVIGPQYNACQLNFPVLGAGVAAIVLSPSNVLEGVTVNGPGVYANPSTNPAKNANCDGVNLSGAMAGLEHCQVQNFDAGVILGDHAYLWKTEVQANYYGLYVNASNQFDQSIWLSRIQNSMMAAVAVTGSNAGGDAVLSMQFFRTHIASAPFAFYQEAGPSASMSNNLDFYQLSAEQIGNAFIFTEQYNTPGLGHVNGVHNFGAPLGWQYTGVGSVQQRTDKPHAYGIYMGPPIVPWYIYGYLTEHDSGAIYAPQGLNSDLHFYAGNMQHFGLNAGGADGHEMRLHMLRQGVSNFPNGSVNGATVTIGSPDYPGTPASLQLVIQETSDGGVVNNMIVGPILSSPTLVTPFAPAAALVTSAGNIDAGSHSYKVVSTNGGLNGGAGNSLPSAGSNAVTHDASHAKTTVTLPNNSITPAGAPTVTYSVYRNKVADQTHWFLVQSGIALGTPSVVDNLGDASLGAAMPTVVAEGAWQATLTLRTASPLTAQQNFSWALRTT